MGSAQLAAFSLGGWFGWLAVAARRLLPASQSLLLLVLLPLPPLPLLLLLLCIYLSGLLLLLCVCDDDVAAVVLYAPGYT